MQRNDNQPPPADALQTEARFRSLLEAAPDGIVIVAADGGIVLVNTQTEHLFGYRREDLVGKPVEILIPGRFASHESHRAKYFETPRTRPMGAGLDLYGRRADGSEFPVEISLSPLVEGDQVLVTAIVRDVTERKLAEAQRLDALRQADKVKDEFLSILSHELRTPINAITGFGSTMLDGVFGEVPERQRPYLARMLEAADALAYLVDDLLDMTRIQAGKFAIAPVPHDFGKVLQEAVSRFGTQAEGKGIRLELAFSDGVERVHGDPLRLGQVLNNLLSNAVKFTPEGGAIAVSARLAGDALRCEVADTGPGIPDEARGRVFERFAQLDTSATRRERGLGLGLSLPRPSWRATAGASAWRAPPGGAAASGSRSPRRSRRTGCPIPPCKFDRLMTDLDAVATHGRPPRCYNRTCTLVSGDFAPCFPPRSRLPAAPATIRMAMCCRRCRPTTRTIGGASTRAACRRRASRSTACFTLAAWWRPSWARSCWWRHAATTVPGWSRPESSASRCAAASSPRRCIT
ncbi:MAG: PAS domain S-box protein [Candidatus Sericytochromatia bacterium]|nr:PAS domain S-box protein [Candidatus Tanganyikabacteria bacterium]